MYTQGMATTPKGKRTRETIIRSAIHCLAKYGYDKLTFQLIADHCGLSQPLVTHYFKQKQNVFPMVFEYLISKGQQAIKEEAVHPHPTPVDQLRGYVREAMKFLWEDPDAAKVVMTLRFVSIFDEDYRKRYVEIKRASILQIANILVEGIKQGQFEVDDVFVTARMINSCLLGVLLDILSEGENPEKSPSALSRAAIVDSLERTCIQLVRYKGPAPSPVKE